MFIALFIRIFNWLINIYVEIKWLFRTINRGNAHVKCPTIGRYNDYYIYEYNGEHYIAHNVPYKDDIVELYDGEHIENVTCYDHHNNRICDIDNKIRDAVQAFAGPLCDFHDDVPTLDVLVMYVNTNMKHIIIQTSCMRELMLEANSREHHIKCVI